MVKQLYIYVYLFLPSPTLSLPASAPETIDAYINASKTVLKQGEELTVNCTVHGVQLVFFSWDYPNREVSRSRSRTRAFVRFPCMDRSQASRPSPNYNKM